MIYLKLDDNKTLSYNQQEELYDLENGTNKFSVWLPDSIDNVSIDNYNVLLYIKKDDNSGDVIKITKENNIVTLKSLHTYNTNNITVWIVGEINQEGVFYTNELKFKVNKTTTINEPPQPFQITYFEQVKKDIENSKSIIGRKTSEGGEIFNDYENNKAIAPYTHTEGQGNISGSKCFKFDMEHEYTPTDFSNNTDGSGWYYLTSVEGIEPEMVYSIILKANYEYNGKVLEVDSANRRIYVTNYYIPLKTEYTISESSYIHFPDYPELGTDNIGVGASVRGIGNKALSDGSDSSGIENTSSGKYSTTHGKKNKAGYAADAGGQETQAIADLTMTRGYKTKATGNKATALGEVTKAPGENALAHGQIPTEVPEGQTPKKGAAGKNSRTGGYDNEATGLNSEATGSGNSAQADNSFVAGLDNKSEPQAKNSFVGGAHNTAVRENQTVIGEFADTQNEKDALFVIGNDTDWWQGNRSNALVVRKNGQIIGKASPNTKESLTNKDYVDKTISTEISDYVKNNKIVDQKYVDENIDNKLAELFDAINQQDASFIFKGKKYYLTDTKNENSYCIFSDIIDHSDISFDIIKKENNILTIDLESFNISISSKDLFNDFSSYQTIDNYQIGTDNSDKNNIYYFNSFLPYSIPSTKEIESFFIYNNVPSTTINSGQYYVRNIWHYLGSPYIRYSDKKGNINNLSLIVSGNKNEVGSKYFTNIQSTVGTYAIPNIMYVTYIDKNFFLENRLNVYLMGSKFKELLSTMFTIEELRSVYTDSEIFMIFGCKIIENIVTTQTKLS